MVRVQVSLTRASDGVSMKTRKLVFCLYFKWRATELEQGHSTTDKPSLELSQIDASRSLLVSQSREPIVVYIVVVLVDKVVPDLTSETESGHGARPAARSGL